MNTPEAAVPVSDTNSSNGGSSQVPTPFYLTFLWACNLLWTLILLGLNVWEFLQKGHWLYQGPGSLIYFATLAAYAGAKETREWTQVESQAELKGRKGILFVGVWVLFSMGAFVAVNLGQGYAFPHELLTITLEVLGIFFGTQASKALRHRRGTTAVKPGLEESILNLAKENGGVPPALVAQSLGVTRWDAQYAIKKLVKDGRLKKVGDSTNPETKYEVV